MTPPLPARLPRPAVTAPAAAAPQTFRRYPPGTSSATVETIRLADGRSVRTDLIRLNPDLECYSLDLGGTAPRQVAHYTVTPWARMPALERAAPDVRTILRASCPAVGLAELSARVRAAGHPLGAANLRAHDAIAATQAALWHVTNGVDLDTRPVATPVATAVTGGCSGAAVPVAPEQPVWAGALPRGRAVRVQLTLADRLQLGSYSVRFSARSQLAGARVSLERSPDGSTWAPVPSSTVAAGGDLHLHKALGVGATLADALGLGYAHYRVVLTTDSPGEPWIGVEQVTLTPAGAARYANPDRVVHLYDYLVSQLGRRAAPPEQVGVELTGASAPDRRVVGPIRVRGAAPGQRVRLRAMDPGAYVVDGAGDPVFGPLAADQPLFVRLPRRRPTPLLRLAVTLTPADVLEPQLLLGAGSPGGPARFTPVVRLAPAQPEAVSTLLLDLTTDLPRLEGVD